MKWLISIPLSDIQKRMSDEEVARHNARTNQTPHRAGPDLSSAAHTRGHSNNDPISMMTSLTPKERNRISNHLASIQVPHMRIATHSADATADTDGDIVGDYIDDVNQVAVDLSRLQRAIESGCCSTRDLANGLEGAAKRCASILSDLKNDIATGLKNTYR
ncbi:MAG: hypothetical protein ACLQU2_03350 [Candidatus Binataceae bacterium]